MLILQWLFVCSQYSILQYLLPIVDPVTSLVGSYDLRLSLSSLSYLP